MLKTRQCHAVINARVLGIVGEEVEAVAIKLLDAEMRVVFRVGHGRDRVVMYVQIPDGCTGRFGGFKVHVGPILAKVLHIAVDRVDLCGDAQTSCHADEEDVAGVAVGLAGFQHAYGRDGETLRVQVVIDADIVFHPFDQEGWLPFSLITVLSALPLLETI